MPLDAFLLALAAAFAHALWNILLARARDPQAATAVALLVSIVVFAPVAALTWELERAAWPYLAVTSVLQLVYFGLLIYAYRRGAVRRLPGRPWPRAGARPRGRRRRARAATSRGQVGGVLLVGLGVLLVRGLRAEAGPVGLAFGVLIACVIAVVHAPRLARDPLRECDHLPRGLDDPLRAPPTRPRSRTSRAARACGAS